MDTIALAEKLLGLCVLFEIVASSRGGYGAMTNCGRIFFESFVCAILFSIMDILEWAVGGFLLSGGLTFLAIRFFPKIKLLDSPERYGLSRPRLPYPGGIIFVFLILFLCGFFVSSFVWLLVLLFVLGFLSFIDDRYRVPTMLRLFLHIALAAFAYWAGVRIGFVGNPFVSGTSFNLTNFPILSLALTIVWIVVIQNAMNWFDNLPGLAVGVSGIGFLALGVFGLVRQEVLWEAHLHSFLLFSFYLFSLCAGAFLFFWRGKILLGDTGSQVLGFLLAVLSLLAGTKIATTVLVLALPILDSFFVVFRRMVLQKKSPFRGDTDHLPHCLSVKIGEKNATLFLVGITFLFGGIAVFFTGFTKLLILTLVSLFVLGLSALAYTKKAE